LVLSKIEFVFVVFGAIYLPFNNYIFMKIPFTNCQLFTSERISSKLLTLTFALLLLVFTCFSQDVILKKDGNEIKALVTEVLDESIKYHKFDNQAGPIYSIKKSEVFMITYKNGSKDIFKEDESKQKKSEEKESSPDDEKENSDKPNPDKARIDALASNVYSQIINCCSGRKENARFEIYYDGILKNPENGELKVPIKVSWQGAFEATKWVKGVAISFPDKHLGWLHQSNSGGLGMGCAKNCKVK